MRLRFPRQVLPFLVTAAFSSCGRDATDLPVAPHIETVSGPFADQVPLPDVRFNEIHYDNAGTDSAEAIEVAAPAGMDLTGWQIVLYNGSNGTAYNTRTLSETVPASCGALGVLTFDYPTNGIQNGSPDGLALVNASGTVVEFLSYEGTLTATDGPAAGLESTDIGVSETSTTPTGESLQRDDSGAWHGPLAETFGACNGGIAPPPPPPALPPTRISELHYDNDGTDTGEAVEVEGPAGASVDGWSVVLYNGNGGGSYNTTSLSGTIPATCDARGVVALSYPSNGIQNGSPDGLALVDAGGSVVEFLSYEGTMTAADGPAAGMTSTDIGVSEASTTPAGQSLQRDSAGAWQGPSPQSFGACNGMAPPPPPPPPPPSDAPIVIDELLADPLHAAGGASWGEWFEVHNAGTEAVDLEGWTISSAGQPDHVIASSVVVPAGGYAVLGRGYDPARNGGITLDYNYYDGSSTIWLDNADALLLRDGAGALVDSVRWTSGTMAKGMTRALRDADTPQADVDGGAWGYSTTPFGDGDFGTPGAPNGTLSDTPPPLPNYITFSGRLASDPALPVGFEDQLFATLHDGTGASVTTSFTWAPETPDIATIDAYGVMHAVAAGTATFRATAADGTTATYSLPTAVATLSAAQYGDNTEFGTPEDGDASDDFIVQRPEYTTSYNPSRGQPNWVSYDLDASQFGSVDRCDCFTFDPELPAGFTHLTTNDYTGAGAAAGYGIDRGHLARSFDRTAGTLDNATTYYLSNIIPQASDLNQGPWANLENYLGDLARSQGKEVYIITGATGSKGTVKGEGKIVIPSDVWKVAVIMPRDEGLADVHDYRDLEVIAVIMPNEAGVRNVDWHTYQTTVDAVEALSGYDLLSALPDKVERTVESNAQPPIAGVDGPYASTEGAQVPMSAAASVDPNGSIVDYAWTFGDGSSATGASVTHAYAQDGQYAVRLIVTDNDGLADSVTTSVSVANVAPQVAPLAPDTLLPGGLYAVSGSFVDPGADPWTATVDYGDGAGPGPLALSGHTFSLSHTYCAPGAYTVDVGVTDDHATGHASGSVTVLTLQQALAERLVAIIQQLVDTGRLVPGVGNAFIVQLRAVAEQATQGNVQSVRQQLRALELELDALVDRGEITPATAAALQSGLAGISGCMAS